MLSILELLFSWLPPALGIIAITFVMIFLLAFFISIILKIIEIIRG